jgi:hypothetical protein
MDRVALVAFCWFAFWTGMGTLVGRLLDTPGTFIIVGFVFALATVFAWPWVLPERLQRWMEDS